MRKSYEARNRLRLLKLIRRHGGISRTELAELSGLTKSTVTALVAEMTAGGIVREAAVPTVGRGRPRVQLEIDERRAHAVALFPLENGTVSIDVIDLKGRRVFSSLAQIRDFDMIDDLPRQLSEPIEAAIAGSLVPRSAIGGIGIVLPGLVDRIGGVVHWLPSAAPHAELPLGRRLSDRLGVPVSLENRATILARAEHWFGDSGGQDDFTLIALMELGMGGARYVEGELLTGVHGMNSEFGHVKVAFENGRSCHCGGSGCLTTYASAFGVLTELVGGAALQTFDKASIRTLFDEAVAKALSGDERARAEFERAGRALAVAVASHINEQDPGRVVVVTAHPDHAALMAVSFQETVAAQTLPALRERTEVDLRPIQHDDLWKGSASLALERIYAGRSVAEAGF
ncbi:ROK family transcriptional regulator (plasmid) [Novosphingobium sp. BL-8A]|uniref:ROK family transcriptional regulator n=1 Tax=Novosphingobium sp. BL-8A TaxID=3127639 RepID=UPI003756E1A9